jgi:excisionase family DNA binding protein
MHYAAKKDETYQLTPAEMVTRKTLLRVDEAAYCLNISERQVYNWIAEGKLRRVKEQPVRVPAVDVHSCMTNFAE